MRTLNRFFVEVLVLFTVVANTAAQDYTTWSLPEGAKARLGKGEVGEIKYSPDGTRLAVAGSIGIWIYDAQTAEVLDLLTGHTSSVSSIAYSPDGKTLASAEGSDGIVRLWDVKTGSLLHTLARNAWDHVNVSRIAFSPDSTTIATGGTYGSLGLWDVKTGSLLHTLTEYTLDDAASITYSPVQSIAYSPDGKTLASAEGWEDGFIHLWDVKTGSLLRTLTEYTSFVSRIAFSPDGGRLPAGVLTALCYGIQTRGRNSAYSLSMRVLAAALRIARMDGRLPAGVLTALSSYGNSIPLRQL